MKHRILHLADMNVDTINYDLLYRALQCGFTDIQISPVQSIREEIPDWWNLYQPTDITVGNKIANITSLRNLANRCKLVGLGLIVDIVTHHTTTDLSRSNLIRLLYDESRLVQNYESRYESTHYRVGGLPTLDMWGSKLQSKVNTFIHELIDCGVTGLRWDACKHIELPCEGCSFFTNTMQRFTELFQYGEVIFTPHDLLKKYQEIMIVGTENPQGTDDSKCVLWVESHDSFREGWSNYLDSNTIVANYYRLLSEHPNANTLFYQRPYDNSWKNIKH